MKRIIIMMIAVAAMASCEKEKEHELFFEYALFEIECSSCEIAYVNGGVNRKIGGLYTNELMGNVMIDGKDSFDFWISDGYRFSKDSTKLNIKMSIKDVEVYNSSFMLAPKQRDSLFTIKFR